MDFVVEDTLALGFGKPVMFQNPNNGPIFYDKKKKKNSITCGQTCVNEIKSNCRLQLSIRDSKGVELK